MNKKNAKGFKIQPFQILLCVILVSALFCSSSDPIGAQAVASNAIPYSRHSNALANQPPLAVDDSGPGFTTTKYQAFTTGNVMANDSDPDGDRLFIQSLDTSMTTGIVKGDGSLDLGYGDAGKAIAPFEYWTANVSASALQQDGKLVVAGDFWDDFALARFTVDGKPDPDFGVNGQVITDFGGIERGNGIVIQPDGKIVMVGVSDSRIALARYNPNGNLDSGFGSNGKVVTSFASNDAAGYGITLLHTFGRIVVSGTAAGNFVVLRYSSDGNLDSSFGGTGFVLTDFDNQDTGYAVTSLADDKVVVAGTTDYGWGRSFAMARYNVNGSLDAAFGTGGLVRDGLEGLVKSMAVDSDGKIVTLNNGGNWALARHNPDGSLDTSFSEDGKAYFDLNTGIPDAIAIQADRKIVVSGWLYGELPFNGVNFGAIRVNSDGNQDMTFGENGLVRLDILGFEDYVHSVAIQADGKILLAGTAKNVRGNSFAVVRLNAGGVFSYDPAGKFGWLAPSQSAEDKFKYTVSDGSASATATVTITINGVNEPINHPPAAVDDLGAGFSTNKYTPFLTENVLENDSDPDGEGLSIQGMDTSQTKGLVYQEYLDYSFGSRGEVISDFGGPNDSAAGIALQPDNKIVIAGASNFKFSLARYRPDGTLDVDFSGGIVTAIFDWGGEAKAVAVQQDGKIVAAGLTGPGNDYDFALVRYLPDGNLDPAFNGSGKVQTDFGSMDAARVVLAIPGGKILAAGTTGNDFALAMYEANGALSTGFGVNGKVTTDFGSNDEVFAGAAQPDGKFLLVGRTGEDIAMARFNPNGSLDTTFGWFGKETVDLGSTIDAAHGLALLPDGKFLIAGSATQYFMARFNPDGSFDTSFGQSGKAFTGIWGSQYPNDAFAVTPDGKILIATHTDHFTINRFTSSGSPDPTFNMGQGLDTGYSGWGSVAALIAQPDEKFILLGNVSNIGSGDYVIARYNKGGILAYDPNGKFDGLQGGQFAKDNVSYTVTDGVLTDTATVTIEISGVTKINIPMLNKCSTPAIPMVNGDFEAGKTGWTEHMDGYSQGQTIIRNDAAQNGLIPHGGSWLAWIYSGWQVPGGTNSYIEQTLTVPGCQPYLKLYAWTIGGAWCPSRCISADVTADGAVVGQIYLGGSTQWDKVVIDFRSYAGKTITLRFAVGSSDYTQPTLIIDDLVFVSQP